MNSVTVHFKSGGNINWMAKEVNLFDSGVVEIELFSGELLWYKSYVHVHVSAPIPCDDDGTRLPI
jgi:hypothetical protein